MDFKDWSDMHGASYRTGGNEEIADFDGGLTVGIEHGPDDIVIVQDPDNVQETDFRAVRDEVEFTEDGISGDFEGNITDKDGFTLEELKSGLDC